MKKLFPVLVFALISFLAAGQSSSDSSVSKRLKYFVSTNSGISSTPVGFRIGLLDRMGGYIGTRFGKGYKYEEDVRTGVRVSEATLFAANAGLIFPITIRHGFKVHSFFGLGYGKWFSRPSQNGQTVGVEVEGGFMFSYRRFMLNASGNLLTGDGKPAKKDVTVGVGLRF
ncbi:MAG: hypothetical protein JNK18_10050 [Cyclobacteriaceae bacterium]|nr:hypothetical protein [Cyclobacteriaceae bacterium]